MKKEKTFKQNINYFTHGEPVKITGIILLVIVAICYFFPWGFISYIIMIFGLPLGFLLCILGSFGRSNESDIDDFVNRRIGNVDIEIDEDKHLRCRALKSIEPLCTEGYVYREGVMLKRGKGGVTRSSEYAKAIIYHLDTALYISFRSISVVSDEKNEGIFEIPYAEISSFGVLSENRFIPFGKNKIRVAASELRIEYSDGKLFNIPIENSVKTDAYVAAVKEIIDKSKL